MEIQYEIAIEKFLYSCRFVRFKPICFLNTVDTEAGKSTVDCHCPNGCRVAIGKYSQ